MHTENLTLSSVSLENIPHLWEENDILVFFIYLDNCAALSKEFLNSTEKEDLEKLQTLYFKKRFIASRIALKHILCHLLKMDSVLDVSTYKDRYGEVRILDHEDLHICISYSDNVAALAVSKVNIGIDIETKKPPELRNTSKYLHNTLLFSDKSVTDTVFLKEWTIKEAYCKFSNISMLSFLNKEPDLNNISYFNFILDNKYIFSIVTEPGRHAIIMNRFERLLFQDVVTKI